MLKSCFDQFEQEFFVAIKVKLLLAGEPEHPAVYLGWGVEHSWFYREEVLSIIKRLGQYREYAVDLAARFGSKVLYERSQSGETTDVCIRLTSTTILPDKS